MAWPYLPWILNIVVGYAFHLNMNIFPFLVSIHISGYYCLLVYCNNLWPEFARDSSEASFLLTLTFIESLSCVGLSSYFFHLPFVEIHYHPEVHVLYISFALDPSCSTGPGSEIPIQVLRWSSELKLDVHSSLPCRQWQPQSFICQFILHSSQTQAD